MSTRIAAALASSHLAVALLLAGSLPSGVAADSLKPADLARIRAATFEVVMKKPETDSLTYERPLPLELLPYSERSDKYISIGTAFAIGENRYVTAAHVLQRGFVSQYGEPALRGGDGVVHVIDSVHQYSASQDFAVFSLQDKVAAPPLPGNRKPALNQTVYAVGNALGEGIVVRDGLFTSQTPEERHGEWKWIRFSAAASPGNSGGPLLDTDGRVIGVVLRKSENENLNYAVPIELVLDAPANVAKIRYEMVASLPIMESTESGENVLDVPLPRSLADLGHELATKAVDYYIQLQGELQRKQADTIFPKGAGSQALLHTVPRLNGLGLVYRGEDGNWSVFWPQQPQTS